MNISLHCIRRKDGSVKTKTDRIRTKTWDTASANGVISTVPGHARDGEMAQTIHLYATLYSVVTCYSAYRTEKKPVMFQLLLKCV